MEQNIKYYYNEHLYKSIENIFEMLYDHGCTFRDVIGDEIYLIRYNLKSDINHVTHITKEKSIDFPVKDFIFYIYERDLKEYEEYYE